MTARTSPTTLPYGPPPTLVERRVRSLETLLGHIGAARTKGDARRQRLGTFLTTLGDLLAARAARPREGAPDVLEILGLAARGDTHAALLAWALDPQGEHALGDRFARVLLARLGRESTLLDGRYRVHRDGEIVWLDARRDRAVAAPRPGALALQPPGALALHLGHHRRHVADLPSGGQQFVGYDVLGDVLAAVAPEARAESRPVMERWANVIRTHMLGSKTMTDWKGFSPDVKFLLEHWQEYLDVLAVRAELDREFDQVRQAIVARLRERYPAQAGWDATVDEDWILLRRASWPVPHEEWLAFVVVLTDVEAVMAGASDGWRSALSLPTDGDFDADTFSSLVRAKLDPASWKQHLGPPAPGFAFERRLPPVEGRAVVLSEIERIALDEFARYVQLVPAIDQVLRDMG